MNVLLMLFILVIFYDIKFSEKNCFFEDYCSLSKTNSIKGIFAIVIMFCHSMDYFPLGETDRWLEYMSVYLKQLIVVPILFYSGFGIMESIQNKGLSYIKRIPVHNALKTMIWADVCVMVFALYYLFSGKEITLKQFVFSLFFWDHIENNAWYFFVIVILYLVTYVAFRLSYRNYYLAAIILTVISVAPFAFLIQTREIFWYNTFFVFHFGVWFSLLRRYIEKIAMCHDIMYLLTLIITFFGFTIFRRFGSFYYFIICGCFFCMSIVILTMKVSVNNSVLQFLGRHVFGFYALQRLPMKLISATQLETWEKFLISILATAVLSVVFDYIAAWLNRIFFCKIK